MDDDGEADDGESNDGEADERDGGGCTRVDAVQLGATQSTPEWYRSEEEATGKLTVIDSRERLDAALRANRRLSDALDEDASDERRSAVESLLADIGFETATLLLVEAVGPDACYDAVEVSNVRVEEGRIAACARAVDTCGAGELAAQALTFPAALVRVTVDGSPPGAASVTITDGWGRSATARASGTKPLASDSDRRRSRRQPRPRTQRFRPRRSY